MMYVQHAAAICQFDFYKFYFVLIEIKKKKKHFNRFDLKKYLLRPKIDGL